MTSLLISVLALALTYAVVYLIIGSPLIDRAADLDTLHELTRKDHR